MSAAALVLLIAAVLVAPFLLRPAIQRTDLGFWHPTVIWLALMVVFFGLGSAALALDDRPGPALMVAGAIIAFAVAVAASDRLARSRTTAGPVAAGDDLDEADPAPLAARGGGRPRDPRGRPDRADPPPRGPALPGG